MSFNPKQKYTIREDIIGIKEFFDYKEDYVIRPPYQRKNVWSLKKKQNLLDSLFRRYYVPKIVIREVRLNNERTVREVIDGQQRIATVQDFFCNDIKLPKSLENLSGELPNKYYENLNAEFRRFIDRELKYNVDIVVGIDDPKNTEHQEVATEIFWRLQQGESLNMMEIAHARLSSLTRNFIVKYSDDISFDFERYTPLDTNPSKHKFFSIINRKNDRMQHLALMARFILIEQNNEPTDLKNEEVENLIDTYRRPNGIDDYSFEQDTNAKKCISCLNLFFEIFKNDPMIDSNSGTKELSEEYFIISLYLLLRHLKNYYVFGNDEKEIFRNFVFDFHQRWSRDSEQDVDIVSFREHRQQDKNSCETRDRIIRQLFFDYLNSNKKKFKVKDTTRFFNEAKKISVYRREKGLCKLCLADGKSEIDSIVSWSEYQTDHIISHITGGKTEELNAQVLCRYHNAQKGRR